MKIALWASMAAVGLTFAACGSGNDNTSSTTTGTTSGSTGSTGGTGTTGGSTSTPTDFAQFVNQQVGSQPAFGSSAPVSTAMLTTDLSLGNSNNFVASFGSGDAVAATTYQASVGCTQAGKTACNPSVSADLNSTVN